ncbi:MAG: CoA transferase [Actinomycetia bacterium]|nr:CoA transferase [Actinomycetes bacterium]
MEPLEGTVVVDLTQNVAGPLCTQILSDLGARVIKVEPPGRGDSAREWRPHDSPASNIFLALNRNKESIVVDADRPEGQRIIQSLAARADVFVHSLKPGSAESRHLGYEELAGLNPRLVYCAISAFGEAGPLKSFPGFDPLLQALAGLMHMPADHPPDRVSVSLVDMGTGMWAAMGILAGLAHRARTGRGVRVAASLMETALAWQTLAISNYLNFGVESAAPTGAIAPYETFRTRDGWVMIAAGNDRFFERLRQALDVPELADRDRFGSNPLRVKHRAEVHRLLEAATVRYPTAELVERLRAAGVPAGPVQHVEAFLEDPQAQSAGMTAAVSLPDGTRWQYVYTPIRLGGERGSIRRSPPLALGRDTDAVLDEWGFTEDERRRLRADGIIA